MAKIKVTKVNPAGAIENCATLLKMIGVDTSEVPAEHDIWIDTKFITQIDTILPDALSGGAFYVHVSYSADAIPISIKDFDRLLETWKEDEK